MDATLSTDYPRFARFLPGDHSPTGVMHVVDRVVGRAFLLGPAEKDHFRQLLDRLLPFTGLELLTWVCLDNHYHLLLRVPNRTEAERLRQSLTDEQILARAESCFSAAFMRDLRWKLAAFRRAGKPEMAQAALDRLRNRMFDISAFMHMLKRRFSAWFNQQHNRKGTLWEGRFRSVLVEDSESSLLRIAAYIDLNPVRAGIVTDPRNYRWCGYAEAVAGKRAAQQGLREVVCTATATPTEELAWEETRSTYHEWLFDAALELRDEEGRLIRKGLSHTEVERIRASGGQLSPTQLLHCRVRYFSDGLAIGTRAFVNTVYERYRRRFSSKQICKAKPMRWGQWDGLCSLRDLRKEVIRGDSSSSSPPRVFVRSVDHDAVVSTTTSEKRI